MPEYTPTTEEVRSAYQMTDDGLDFKRAAELRGEEFDRWLADRDKEVAAQALEAAAHVHLTQSIAAGVGDPSAVSDWLRATARRYRAADQNGDE